MAAAVANPQQQQQQSQRYVSSIPLTPARSRDAGSTSTSTSRRHGQQQHSSSSRWEDITKERLPGPDLLLVPVSSAGNAAGGSPRVTVDATALNASVSSLPEDHLEDLLTLPMAQELRPRRARSKASLTTIASENGSTITNGSTAFPSTSTPKKGNLSAEAAAPLSPDDNDGGDATGASMSASHADSGARDSPYQPPTRSHSLRKRTQSTPLRNNLSSTGTDPSAPPLTAISSSSSKIPKTAGSGHSPAASPVLGTSTKSGPAAKSPGGHSPRTRARAVTNNLPASGTPKSGARKVQGTPGSSPSLNGRKPVPSSIARSPSANRLQQKKSTPPSPATPYRSRAGSLSSAAPAKNALPDNGDGDPADWDPNAAPPWLADQQEHLYRSDIVGLVTPQPGSLADIALLAQQKQQYGRDRRQADSGNASLTEAELAAANTSTRSWDDVILPAVAKQIRAQQMLATQQQQQQEREASTSHGPAQPATSVTHEERTRERSAEAVPPSEGSTLSPATVPGRSRQASKESLPSRNGSTAAVPMYLIPPASASASHQSQSASAHNINGPPSLSSQQHGAASSGSATSLSQPSYHSTGRQEIWQHTPLSSPTAARQHGFSEQQRNTQPMVLNPAAASGLGGHVFDEKAAELARLEKERLAKEEERHAKKGVCRCIIM